MNRAELVDAVAAGADLPRAKAGEAVEAALAAIEAALQGGREVRLSGFGTFMPTRRKAAKGRNPRTGEVIDLPETSSVRFKPARIFKQVVGGPPGSSTHGGG